jgi:hypothetical protein
VEPGHGGDRLHTSPLRPQVALLNRQKYPSGHPPLLVQLPMTVPTARVLRELARAAAAEKGQKPWLLTDTPAMCAAHGLG